jgi:hypothetical protein
MSVWSIIPAFQRLPLLSGTDVMDNASVCVCVCVCMHARVCVCMSAYVHAHACVYIYNKQLQSVTDSGSRNSAHFEN